MWLAQSNSGNNAYMTTPPVPSSYVLNSGQIGNSALQPTQLLTSGQIGTNMNQIGTTGLGAHIGSLTNDMGQLRLGSQSGLMMQGSVAGLTPLPSPGLVASQVSNQQLGLASLQQSGPQVPNQQFGLASLQQSGPQLPNQQFGLNLSGQASLMPASLGSSTSLASLQSPGQLGALKPGGLQRSMFPGQQVFPPRSSIRPSNVMPDGDLARIVAASGNSAIASPMLTTVAKGAPPINISIWKTPKPFTKEEAAALYANKMDIDAQITMPNVACGTCGRRITKLKQFEELRQQLADDALALDQLGINCPLCRLEYTRPPPIPRGLWELPEEKQGSSSSTVTDQEVVIETRTRPIRPRLVSRFYAR